MKKEDLLAVAGKLGITNLELYTKQPLIYVILDKQSETIKK
jgi:hypothetical protein